MDTTPAPFAPVAANDRALRQENWITLSYLAAAAMWIYFSDRAVGLLAESTEQVALWSTFKGWGFVAVTGLLLHIVLGRAFGRIRAAQARLSESERRFRELVQGSPDAVVIDQDDHIIFANESAVGLFRAGSVDGLIGRSAYDMVHPSDHEAVRARRAAEAGGSVDKKLVVRRLKRLDGTSFHGEVAVAPFHHDGAPARQVVIRDVTPRLEAEEEMRRLQDELARVARLSTLGEMVAGIAHELNQPLYSALNFGKACRNLLAVEGPIDTQNVREWTDETIACINRAGAIVAQLRSLTRKSPPTFAPVPLAELIEESIHLLGFEARRDGVVVRTAFETKPIVVVDRIRVQQVLINLIRNAFEALQAVDRSNRRLTIATAAAEGWAEITVADSGPGLSAEEPARIFEAFVTTKPDGMGLGLAISRTIVETHGGRIWTTESPDGGASFHFTLPLQGADVRQNTGTPS